MRRNQRRPSAAPEAETLSHQPFRALKGTVRPARPAPPVSVSTQREAATVDPDALFREAMADVRPLDPRARERREGPSPAADGRPVTPPDAEALAELCDLVAGSAPFDLTQTDEHVEGAVVGLDPRLLRRVRAGEFAYQAHLDLHGMTADEARPAVETFLAEAYRAGKRCVLIVHGRGLNSKDQVPVLKSRLTSWLARGQFARLILAFTSARPCDGGAGALYVVLRRRRDARQPIRVTAGAKW
jgi:DNA-nicking Smr family endonuclease